MLADSFFKLLRAVALHHRVVHLEGRNLQAHCLLGAGGGQRQAGERLGQRAQVFGDFGVVGLPAAGSVGRNMPGGQHHRLDERGGGEGGQHQGGSHFVI